MWEPRLSVRVRPASLLACLPVLLAVLLLASSAVGSVGDCGQPRSSGALPTATDALEALKTSIGLTDCGGFDFCVCDVDSSASVTASDALRVLQKAVGLDVALVCPCGVTTTTLSPSVLTTEQMTLVRLQGSYALADLAGTWELSEHASGPDGPWWGRGTLTISSNGSFSGNVVDSDGLSDNLTGRLALSKAGIVSCSQNCSASLNGALDSGKDVVFATETWDDGTAAILAMVRRATTYAQSDLAGTWGLSALASGPRAPYWQRGPLMVASNGSFTGTIADSDGGGDAISGTLPLSASGAVTCVSSDCAASFRGALDAGKSLIVATETTAGGSTQLRLVAKRAASYAQADLTGMWRLNSIVSGQDQPWWSRGTLSIAANGALSGTIVTSDDEIHTAEGTLRITPAGIVTLSNDSDFECAMDADKTVVVCTDTW